MALPAAYNNAHKRVYQDSPNILKLSSRPQPVWLPVIIPPMGSDASLSWTNSWANRNVLHPSDEQPYLCIQEIVVFVRDLDLSRRFYVDQLGFELIADQRLASGERWIEVAPPDGSANLALVAPKPDRPEYKLIGRNHYVFLMTEDVQAKYKEWSERGVHFLSSPEEPVWGGTFTRFEDPDGNLFGLEGFDEVRRSLELRRQAHAKKVESERRAAQELEIAKQVQARLFPQFRPELKTIEYAGMCLQARQVGGDYFDFLNLGPERLALIIADVSGKGIAAALLMANLQASLRSQSALALDLPEVLLRSVNRLFFENTSDGAFASLLFADYNAATRQLRYANCGHLSGLLLRTDGSLEQLQSTGTLLGLFKDWDCSMREQVLFPGDVLALYTDGITEARNELGEEFGERRLIELLRQHRELSCQNLLTAIVDGVRRFSSQEQHDDITAIVAKVRATC
jgi:serine phosphatase RsbU (regulator of sigma subunit)/catechol 2,3-dioxygenase-like lactoylglutathione lyase family enzyme